MTTENNLLDKAIFVKSTAHCCRSLNYNFKHYIKTTSLQFDRTDLSRWNRGQNVNNILIKISFIRHKTENTATLLNSWFARQWWTVLMSQAWVLTQAATVDKQYCGLFTTVSQESIPFFICSILSILFTCNKLLWCNSNFQMSMFAWYCRDNLTEDTWEDSWLMQN